MWKGIIKQRYSMLNLQHFSTFWQKDSFKRDISSEVIKTRCDVTGTRKILSARKSSPCGQQLMGGSHAAIQTPHEVDAKALRVGCSC